MWLENYLSSANYSRVLSAIFVVLKHVQTLLKVREERIQRMQHLSNLLVECVRMKFPYKWYITYFTSGIYISRFASFEQH